MLSLVALLAAAHPARAAALPPVKHAFVLVLENKDYEQSFGKSSPAPYLAKELTAKGQLLTQYFGTSHASLGNYLTMVSGQAPNPDTQADCNSGFKDIFPGTPTPDGQTLGAGCVYPPSVATIGDQLEAKGLSWKGYMEDMGTPCRHPGIGENDDTQSARKDDQYATRHNPFVYFHSIIDDDAGCKAHVVDLKELAGDLGSASTTPALSFITPDLCSDGHDEPCVDGRPGGLKSVDAFLKEWVPRIMGSPAYADGGLLMVTWDEANIGEGEKSASCCNQPTGPNTPSPGIFGPGGGRTGSVVLSPFVAPGSVNATPYNHYGLLRTLEDLFGVGHLGYAGMEGLRAFGSDVFSRSDTIDLSPPTNAATAPCSPRKLSGTSRRLAPGSVITTLRARRRSGKPTQLEITATRSSRLIVRVRGTKHARTARLARCRSARVSLGRRHGQATVTVTVGRRYERRTVMF